MIINRNNHIDVCFANEAQKHTYSVALADP